MNAKGIILAGGNGTRLYPLTKVISKHLLPIYNYPMIMYPFMTLIQSGIKNILIISNKEYIDLYKKYFDYITKLKTIHCNISYAIQKEPRGIPEAFLIAEDCGFINKRDIYTNIALILGDNIFYSKEVIDKIKGSCYTTVSNIFSTIFLKEVNNPERYGVYDLKNRRIIEKPKKYISNFAVTGLYVYNSDVIDICKTLSYSPRGELEITEVNNEYLLQNRMSITYLNNTEWFDAGTVDSLLDCNNFIASVIRRNGELF